MHSIRAVYTMARIVKCDTSRIYPVRVPVGVPSDVMLSFIAERGDDARSPTVSAASMRKPSARSAKLLIVGDTGRLSSVSASLCTELSSSPRLGRPGHTRGGRWSVEPPNGPGSTIRPRDPTCCDGMGTESGETKREPIDRIDRVPSMERH
jgi:hypothetical protein